MDKIDVSGITAKSRAMSIDSSKSEKCTFISPVLNFKSVESAAKRRSRLIFRPKRAIDDVPKYALSNRSATDESASSE